MSETAPSPIAAGLAAAARNTGFWMSLAMLIGLTAAYQLLMGQTQIIKHALPMKKPLDQLNKNRLGPYEFVQQKEIDAETVNTLGTDQYILWDLIDTDIEDESAPERYVNLFITYYTGQPDQVPHVPEVCQTAGGREVEESTLEEVNIPNLNGGQAINMTVLKFRKPVLLEKNGLHVMYLFKANDQFVTGRHGVRIAVGDKDAKYAYFSKVEITFGRGRLMPTGEVAVEAGKKLLRTIIPILVEDHWPDWDSAVHGGVASDVAQADEAESR